MLTAGRIKSKPLRRLFKDGDESGINPNWRHRVKRIMAALNVAVAPAELNIPGYRWHQQSGNRKDTYSVTVNRNWRITYKWDNDGPFDVNLEDYHNA